MINVDETRKALNFDLINRQLKQHYPTKNYKHAWRDIKDFLEKHGFTHRQYSGYLSNQNISFSKINEIVLDMQDQFPWLKLCVREFDVTLVVNQFSLLYLLH